MPPVKCVNRSIPSRPGTIVARYRQATLDDVEPAIDLCQGRCRRLAVDLPDEERAKVLFRVADQIAQQLGRVDGSYARRRRQDADESLTLKSPRRSTSADFTRRQLESFGDLSGLKAQGQGTVVVVLALEFSLRDSLRRYRGGVGCWEHGHSQASFGHGADRLRALPMFLAGRRAANGAAVYALQRRHRGPTARHARRRRRR